MIGYRDAETYAREGRLGVCRHVVVAFEGVGVIRLTFGHNAVEDALHVGAHIRIGVLIDGESAAGVLHKEVEQPFARQGRKLTYYFIGYEVEATSARLQGYFNLFYHFLVDELTRNEQTRNERQVDKGRGTRDKLTRDEQTRNKEQGMSEILSLF